MKITFLSVVLFLLTSMAATAEPVLPVALTPTSASYSTGATADPLRHAWTYPAFDGSGHDIWTFDLSAFDPSHYVSIDLSLGDYCCHADDYRLYWDGVDIGNTGLGIYNLFEIETTAAAHTLEVEWLNPIPGGSWYRIAISAEKGDKIVASAVSEPGIIYLFSACLVVFFGIRKRASV